MRSLFLTLAIALPCFAGPEKSAVMVATLQFKDNPKTGRMEGHGGNGSGTCIGHKDGGSLILTCKHVAPAEGHFYFVRVGDLIEPAWWMGCDDKADLALLWIKVKVPVAEIADADPKVGSLLKEWGHPLAGPVDPKEGKVFGDKYSDQNGYVPLVAGFGVRPGDSGAGVFAEGKLCGVCYGGQRDDATGTSYPPCFCVQRKDVKRFLDRFAK